MLMPGDDVSASFDSAINPLYDRIDISDRSVEVKDIAVKLLLLFTVMLGVAACSPGPTPTPMNITLVDPDDLPTSTFTDPAMRGAEQNYQLLCAHCHGYNGEGQVLRAPGETINLGLRVVPPHDSTGSTWRYSDPVLIEVITKGIQNPLDHYPMPGFEVALSSDEIAALLEYIKLWWSDEQRDYQAAVTANYTNRQEDPTARLTPLPTVVLQKREPT